MRNTILKKLRTEWRDSRFFMGRNKIMQVALGRDEAEEYADGLRQVATQLTGNVGLLFTNRKHKEVVSFFRKFEADDYARSGFEATEKVELAKGELEMFETSQEHSLRLLGMPIVLKKGKVCLSRDFTVCEGGETLTPEKAKILEFLGVRMAKFRVVLRCYYRKKDGHFKLLDDVSME
ncbi:putative 60S acidic ribosomal protein P0 [Chondrus crispus]|uniref:Ribosome assembly factor mrt4 n=1 Tax=Chondrus crispus TaxID=2769 RepID=R7QI94_CHOCR|nr:putative 60S acidic ribosomal protein P0 [Chondrus crispus]CDF37135.1 putative 60S acidic ribosomal protein P0 [Chondrus crispus]|eukprot:XP_005716954.1 putative 60S acidic ribosomal protein P0 [Chondrus crispus]